MTILPLRMFKRHFFRSYQQLEQSDCGITCIRMIARYYGKKVSPQYLKSICDSNKLGVSIGDVIDTLKAIDIEALPIKITSDRIIDKDLPLPAILFWNNTHFVVLYKITSNRFYIADPGMGKMSFNREDFITHWIGNHDATNRGIIILAEPNPEFYNRKFDYKSNTKSLIDLIRHYSQNNKASFLSIFILTALMMLADICTPLLFQQTIDNGIGHKDISLVWILILSQLLIIIGNFVANAFADYIVTKLGLRINMKIMGEYLTKLVNLPMNFFSKKVNSDLIQKADDQERLKEFLTHIPQTLFFNIISVVVFSLMMIYFSPTVFYIFISATAINVLWNFIFIGKRREMDYSYFNLMSNSKTIIYELINGIHEIKIGSAEDRFVDKWRILQEKICKLSIRKYNLSTILSGGNTIIASLREILITGICATLVIKNSITIGAMMTISYIAGRLSRPYAQLIGLIGTIQDSKMSLERVSDINQVIDIVPKNQQHSIVGISDIRIKDVWFKYPGSNSPFVLKNINVTIKMGSTTAIVGISGGGKTTLTKLILGLHTPSKGNIYIGDIEISEIDNKQWLKNCSCVNQEGTIFSDTILSNIALGEKLPDLARINMVLDAACLRDFITKLPMGLQTKIGANGIDISGGEKQRVLIARALYKDADLIVFDEATSSLDATTESQIVHNITQFAKNKTLIIVAHRLSTVQQADNILYLEDGQIKESGSHKDLCKLKGGYYNLVSNQLDLAVH